MNSKKIKAYIQLSRPVNLLITAASIPVACWIAGSILKDAPIVLMAAVTGILVAAGANAINDFFDVEIDRINRPDRPLPAGLLTRQNAKLMWLVVSVSAICINIFISFYALLIVIFATAILYYYSALLKRTVILGNVVVALMTGMAFIYGGAVAGRFERALLPAVFAFFINFAREIIKDIEDIEGDRKEKAATLPVKYGIKPALVTATILLVILISITFVAIKYAVYSSAFMYIVIIADFLMLFSAVAVWFDSSAKNMRRVSNDLKLSMVIGLLAIIAGSV